MAISKSAVAALLERISATQPVFVPCKVSGGSKFVEFGEGVVPAFDMQNTKEPPKELFFPATEKMYRWKRHEGELSIEQAALADAPFTVFGVRPCDMASIDRLDQVFLTKGFVDEFYEARRNAATVVAMACPTADRTCFCSSMGVDSGAAPSADVLLTDCGDCYEAVAQTPRGEAAVRAWGDAVSAWAPASAPKRAACTLEVDAEGLAEKLPHLFENDLWEDVAASCLTCGTCTFVCPTCYCFDISQDVRADEGSRFRCWDSCMFADYTQMAGGHNPRARKSARVRQRFMHKLCFFEQRYGTGLCVGCGRCMRECPASVDITRIIERIGEADV